MCTQPVGKAVYVLCCYIFIIIIIAPPLAQSSCDRVFEQRDDGRGPFTFEAPTRQAAARPGTLVSVRVHAQGNATLEVTKSNNVNGVGADGKSDSNDTVRAIHCVYKFVAASDSRITLNFTSFRLRGQEPECTQEYVDVYVKLKPTLVGADDADGHNSALERVFAAGEQPNGRFCTSVMPRHIVSLNNVLVLAFYTQLAARADARPLFAGTYEFVNKSNVLPYDDSNAQQIQCTHTIHASERREGEFQSLTYPGVYVKGLRCSYTLLGLRNQRIRLEFLDLDLYSGGSHCPLDSIKVFDGDSESDPIISTICGSHRSLIIFSTHERMLITFTTLQREAEVQNRGFSAYFEFSDQFANPSFIEGANARHIRGSECDQRIVSHKRSHGTISSPEPHHHPNAVCRYVFEGLQTSLDYEKVSIKFTEFEFSKFDNSSKSALNTSGPAAHSDNNLASVASGQQQQNTTEQCPDNYVRLYTGEQKPDQKQDPNDYDYVFCGAEVPQTAIESDAASLFIEYNSGSLGGQFKADYAFMVDYRIPGTQSTSSSCDYTYRSDNMRTGVFNSPRHPSWYINSMNCSYTFMTKPDEVVLIQFNTFKLYNSFNEKILGYDEACNGEDKVLVYELTMNQTDNRLVEQQTHIGTYCGITTPGPILSYKPLRIEFITNKEQVYYGFSAIYSFYPLSGLQTNEFVTNCGGRVQTNQRLRSGTFPSPETYRPETYEKRHHVCFWNITARPNHKIALNFTKFELEGSPSARGCITASIRIYVSKLKTPTEICGTTINVSTGNQSSASNYQHYQFVSEGEWMALTFISTKQASGSNGFVANWFEIKRPSSI